MKYIQFLDQSVTDKTKLIESCGDRAVIILDGRNSKDFHHAIAKEECKKRKYKAYRLYSGESFTRSSPVSEVIIVE